MEFPDLRRLFAPRSVAYIGATEDLRKFGGRCIRELIDFGFEGKVYPVNPNRQEVFGLRCYPSLAEIPEVPDHVGIVLPAERVPAAIEDCVRRKVPFATVFSSGFAELGTDEGLARQKRVVALAREGGLRIVGPNCNGLVNFVDRVAMTSTAAIKGARRAAGDIGVVSHSGGAGQVNIMWRAQEAGLGISHQISCGNDADLGLLDFIAYMVEDPQTRVVLALAERLSDGDKLRALAVRAAELGKPIVMVKVGRSEAGSRMAASHTGAVTGADDVVSAALEQLGIMRVDDCPDLYEAAMLLRRTNRPRGTRLAATSLSGGNLVMLADLGGAMGIEWPQYSESTQVGLRELLPGMGKASNPTDLTSNAIGREDIFTAVCRALHDDANVDVVMPVLTFAPAADIVSLASFAATASKSVALLWTGRCVDDPLLTPARLVNDGLVVFRDALPAMKALRTAVRYEVWRRERLHAPILERPADIDPRVAQRLLSGAGDVLDERAAKELVASYGLPVTREHVAKDAEQAVGAAYSLGGRVALKILSPDLPHKTEAKAIRLNVQGDDAIRRAYREVVAAALAHCPEARIEGVIVQEMVSEGEEFLLGITRDEVFGPVITAGLGGIHVEVLKDVAMRLAPVSEADALRMLRSLHGFPLLEGTRGRPRLDIDSLVQAIVRLSWLAMDARSDLAELDVNPLMVLGIGQGVRVVDAFAVLRAEERFNRAPAS